MTRASKKEINDTMIDVIKTSKDMRDYLLDQSIDLEEKIGKLKILKTALEANKNIVSASVVRVNIEEFK